MATRRSSFGWRWFFLLLVAEMAALSAIFYLRTPGISSNAPPEHFSPVQALNLQSLIHAKGYPCPLPPALRYEQRGQGVRIIATCTQQGGAALRFEIDFKGNVRPL